ncbi:MAG: HPr family phosphocarrier protein [Deltaproteobacteria bacterium]|nr:HPr family phosphocarrier protein [Deltaproteobacteria bacterium]
MADESNLRAQLTLKNKQGLHARAAAVFVRALAGLKAEVSVTWQDRVVNGRSMLDLMTLGAPYGSVLEIQINGADADAALAALSKVAEDRFYEE